MKRELAQKASLLVLLQLITLQSTSKLSVYSFSISSSSNSKSSTNSNLRHNNLQNVMQSPSSSSSQQQQQQQPHQHHNNNNNHQQSANLQLTTLQPPMMTTQQQFASNGYSDSYSTQYQPNPSKQQVDEPQQQHQASERSSNGNEDHDDTVPLATINNHSRNNQPVARPPQYVDVSALVGRDRNLTNSGSPGTNSNGAQGLSPKSRSGLPECATQQVCNAIFVRMNYTQKLCECSSNYNWKCSHNLDPQDGHTIELTRKFDKRIYTQIKTCEPLREVRACKSPTDWTLLALQSERSGKAHYVVVCKCPTWAQLEGPYTHNHPPYANIPGIRVYGMLCAHQTARSSAQTYATYNPALSIYPEFPWSEALNVLNTTNLASSIDSH